MAYVEKQFEVGEHTYRTAKLTAMDQFNVVRRLGKTAAAFAAVMQTVKGQAGEVKADDRLAMMEPLLAAVGAMSDEDVAYVVRTCLAGVTRRVEGDKGWARLTAPTGAMMFPDADDMLVMLQIVWGVLEANLSGFFDELVSASLAEDGTDQTSNGSASQAEKMQ